MRRFLVVILLLAGACGSARDPEASWSFSNGKLACGSPGRLVLDPRVPYDQWCVWDCASYAGVNHLSVAVRYVALDPFATPPGDWVEQLDYRDNPACH